MGAPKQALVRGVRAAESIIGGDACPGLRDCRCRLPGRRRPPFCRDRGEPCPRAVLRQLPLRLGCPDRRRAGGPRRRLLGRRHARGQLPAPAAARRGARGRGGRRGRDPFRRPDGARGSRRLGPRSPREPAARVGAPLRRAERRARIGNPDRRSAARARPRSLRPHSRASLLRVDRRQHRRHVCDGVLARPRARHRPGARRRRRRPLRRRRGRRRRGAARRGLAARPRRHRRRGGRRRVARARDRKHAVGGGCAELVAGLPAAGKPLLAARARLFRVKTRATTSSR
jgi:hypothetical protein